MTQSSFTPGLGNQLNREVRETIEQNFDKLIENIAKALKYEATAAYQAMELTVLREIAYAALLQTSSWMEESSGQIIEADLSDGLKQRLQLGFTIADFVSTTDLIERELKTFCQSAFADRPDLRQRSILRLDGIYTIVRTVEARMVMRHGRKG